MTSRNSRVAMGALLIVLISASGHSQPPLPDAASFALNEVLVRFRDQPTDEEVGIRLSAIGVTAVRRFDLVEGLYLIRLPPGLSVLAGRDAIGRLSSVMYAEPNYLLHATTVPNDPSFGGLWGLHNTGQAGGTVDGDIDAPEAWDITTGSAGVVVAVIDTGVDYAHQDLSANMFQNTADCNSNSVDDDGNGFVDDCYGIDTANDDSNPMDDNNHGTHVSGTIGAAGNNGIGVVGVNWNVRIMACKFLNAGGTGSTSNAIDCLNYVRIMKDRGVNVVATNNSWGGGAFSQALYDAIDTQRQRGVLFIAAAGNSESDNDTTSNYPSNYDLPNVIAVAATTRTEARSSFSSYGRRTVHLGAPGSAILSTTRNNTYASFNGTSMATPHVTGVAALLKAQDANRDWRAIRNLILAGGDASSAMANTITQRRLNAARSLSCSNVVVQSRLRPIPNTVFATAGESVTLRILHINCASPAGNVAVTVSPGGQAVTLVDDGGASDQAAGDGIYSGSFVPVSGTYTLTFPGGDVVTLDVGNAVYDSSLKAPLCAPVVSACSAVSLLNGRDNMTDGLELNQPNTINNSCADGTAGVYHDDESIDGLKVATPDGSALTSGRTARIDATVYVWSPGADRLDLYYTATANAPNWQHLTTLTPPAAGVQVLSVSYTLPIGAVQAIRANFRYQGSPGPCTPGTFDDHDDLIFTVVTGFTDNPLTAGTSVIRAIHFTELRSRIDALRVRYGLSQFPWTHAPLLPGMTVMTVHLTELRTALQQAYAAASRSGPTFTDATIVPGSTLIKLVHIAELRDAVLTLEGS